MRKKITKPKAVQQQAKQTQIILTEEAETNTLSSEGSDKPQQTDEQKTERKFTSFEKAQLCMTTFSLIVAILAVGASVYFSSETIYQTFRTPFSPTFTAQPIIWLIKPEPAPNSFTINATVLTSIANEGALGGVVDNLVLVVSWPNGKWYLSPFNFVKTDVYYLKLFEEDKAEPPQWLESPFTPIYVNGRSQITKAIMFLPNTHDSLNFNLIEVGKHPVTLYARNRGKDFKAVSTTILDVNQEDLSEWKSGKLRQRVTGVTEESARKLLGQ